jgi:hypothetical protein
MTRFVNSGVSASTILAMGLALAGCQTTERVVDGIFGGSEPAQTQQAAPEPAPTGAYPDLSQVPAKPAPETTEEERRQIVDGLAADRERAKYSNEELRGGTDTGAPPAPAPSAPAPAAPTAPPSQQQ